MWIGIANYKFMFTKDPFFWLAFRNTIWIIIVGVPLRIVFAIFTAMAADAASVGVDGLPHDLLPAVDGAARWRAALAFVFLFNPELRARQPILMRLGSQQPARCGSSVPTRRSGGSSCSGLWGVGDAMIIFLAGLLDVPRQLYEAADIEGANGRQKFRYVTLPMISPVIFFSLVIGVIYGFQLFTAGVRGEPRGVGELGDGGRHLGAPQSSMLFYAIYLYQQGFQDFRMGYASAMAWVLFIITMICTIAIVKGSRRWVHYQGGGFR